MAVIFIEELVNTVVLALVLATICSAYLLM
jgi:hypothetical protein